MMGPQFRSSSETGERQRTAAIQTVAFIFVLVWSLAEAPVGLAYPQCKSSVETVERFRFQVADSNDHAPIPGPAVTLIYWQKNATTEEKKEIELKTDKDGSAQFPKVRADRLTLTVNTKGYRSCRRWFRPDQSREPLHVRIER
jgi:hypothetical protein